MTMTSIENKPRVFVDTNVIVDALSMRDVDYLPSRHLWRHIIAGEIKGYICSKQITDLYYIFRKYFKNEETIRQNITNIIDSFETLPLFKGDLVYCLKTEMIDYEDALLCEVAKVNMVPIIVTNNIKHFQNCPIMALTPQQCLDLFSIND